MLGALHPDLELVAATTVNGNVPVEYCTENSLRVFDHIGRAVPVYEGVGKPIARDDFPIARPDIKSTGAVHGGYLDIPPRHQPQAGDRRRRVPDRDLPRRDRADRPRPGRTDVEHRDRVHRRAAPARPGPGARHHGRREPLRERHAARRVQRLGGSRGGPDRARQRGPEDHAGAARCHPQGARLARRLRGAPGAGHAGRRRGRELHRAAHRRLRPDPAHEAAERGARSTTPWPSPRSSIRPSSRPRSCTSTSRRGAS